MKKAPIKGTFLSRSSGGRIRTNDIRVMSSNPVFDTLDGKSSIFSSIYYLWFSELWGSRLFDFGYYTTSPKIKTSTNCSQVNPSTVSSKMGKFVH